MRGIRKPALLAITKFGLRSLTPASFVLIAGSGFSHERPARCSFRAPLGGLLNKEKKCVSFVNKVIQRQAHGIRVYVLKVLTNLVMFYAKTI